jgi:hypothetical protein
MESLDLPFGRFSFWGFRNHEPTERIKRLDEVCEKACRAAKIGVRIFRGYKSSQNAPVAQWIEQQIPNLLAACSIHARGTNEIMR